MLLSKKMVKPKFSMLIMYYDNMEVWELNKKAFKRNEK